MSLIEKLDEERRKAEFEKRQKELLNPRFTTGQGALILRASPFNWKEVFMDEAIRIQHQRMTGK